jgi:hypothetical protein
VSPDAHTPAERADAVLRAAEAAAAAAQAAAAAAHAASLPPPQPPAPAPVPEPKPEPPQLEPAPPSPEPEPALAAEAEPPTPPVHEAGAPARLLAAAGELEAQVAQARAQLEALEAALARVVRPVEDAE